MSGFKCASLNCRGLNKKLKRKTIFRTCNAYDVVCLQETYITDVKAAEWSLDWAGELLFFTGTNNSRGNIILINEKCNYSSKELVIQSERILGLKITVSDMTYHIFNVYSPNDKGEKLKFIDELYSVCRKFDKDNVVLCGDFNIVMSNKDDIISGAPHCEEVVNKFKNWSINCSVMDTWRTLHENESDFTWSRAGQAFTARRLDYCFIKEDLFPYLMDCSHRTIPGTDHKLVLTTFAPDSFKRGRSYFKLNTALLSDRIFLANMNGHIDDFIANYTDFENPEERCEAFKLMVKTKSIEFSKEKNVNLKKNANKLENELKALNIKVSENPNNAENIKLMEQKKKELEVIEINKTMGAMIRSRIKYIQEGEKNTKFFLGMEKSKGNNNVIHYVHDENDTGKQDHIKVLKKIKHYYEQVSKKDISITNNYNRIVEYLQGANHPILSDDDKEECETQITIEEMGAALYTLNNDSAPGIDGIPVPFYKIFWGRIKHIFYESLMYSLSKGELSTSQKRGIITLFHKGKNLRRDDLKNWRPITLTNTDYKIFSKCLALRLQNVLSYIINTNQSGFLKGRSISDHIRTLDDIIHTAGKCNSPGMIVSLDFAKAFDSVDKETILGALRKFNFGNNFIHMVRTIMANTESCVQNGGWLSEWFMTERGVKQGCCVSPLLFLLVAELMAIKLRNNNLIKGISFNTQDFMSDTMVILQYADDTTLILKSKEALIAALNDIEAFALVSGLKLNKSKSVGMWVGSTKHDASTPGGLSWAKQGDNIKILGIYFNAEIDASSIELNWKARIESLEKSIKLFHKRNLSLYGKILISKTFLLSQISFILQSLSLPDSVLTKIDTMIFKFLWQRNLSNKKAHERIKRSVLCLNVNEGGLNMIKVKDQQKVFLLKWLKGLLDNNNKSNLKMSKVVDQYFKSIGGIEYITGGTLTIDKLKLPNIMPRFWRDVIETWYNIKKNHREIINEDTKTILSQPLFFNDGIKYKSNVLQIHSWIKKGIKYVYQLFDRGRMKSMAEIKIMVGNHGGFIFDYNAVINAIPIKWRQQIETSYHESIQVSDISIINNKNREIMNTLNKENKELRSLIGSYKMENICGLNFWLNRKGVNVSKHFIIANVSTKESKLRLLHFKILHNIYPSNVHLFKMKIKETDQCEYCGETDYIEHLFINCARLRGYWENVAKEINMRLNINLKLTDLNILFGITGQNQNYSKKQIRIINHIILIAKMTISKARAANLNNRHTIQSILEAELSLREQYLV